MKPFTFFKVRSEREIPGFEIEPFDNIDTAKDYARFLLKHSEYKAIEIWDGRESIEIERGPVEQAEVNHRQCN